MPMFQEQVKHIAGAAMNLISRRMSTIDASGIRKVFDLGAKMKDPVNLSIGQPDFDIPDELKTIAIDAIHSGFNRYTQTQGTAELNEAIRAYLKRTASFEPEATMVASGVSGALFLLILATIDPGDEVVFPDPYFVMYKHLVNFVGGVPVYVDTCPDFQLDPDKLKAALTDKTKMIIINSPSNPTGVVYPEETIKAIAEIARKRNILLVSDEIYREFCFNRAYPSLATWYPENTVVLNGLSKSVAMTGWRVGFAAGPASIINEMIKLQQYTFVCAPSFAQKAAVRALEMKNVYLDSYRERRDLIYSGLVNAGYEVVKPEGAFYIFPKCPTDEGRFIDAALDNKLLIIPGSVFSETPGWFRISFAADPAVLQKGIEILARLRTQFA